MREPPGRPTFRPPRSRCAASSDPSPTDYRTLFRLVGARWLWFSRLVMDDARSPRSSAIPKVELFAVLDETRPRRRHARARFPRAGPVRARLRRARPRARRARATAAGCSPRRCAAPGATASPASTSTPARSIIRRRCPPTSAPVSRRTSARSSGSPTRACWESCRGLRPSGAAARTAAPRAGQLSVDSRDHRRTRSPPAPRCTTPADQRDDQRRNGQRLGLAEQRPGRAARRRSARSAGPRSRPAPTSSRKPSSRQ